MLSSNTLTSGVHRIPRIIFFATRLMMLIHNPTLIRRCECAEVRAFVCAQPSQPVSFNLPFYARIQRLDAEGELGVGSLLLTAVWRGCSGPLRFLIRYKV